MTLNLPFLGQCYDKCTSFIMTRHGASSRVVGEAASVVSFSSSISGMIAGKASTTRALRSACHGVCPLSR